MGEQTVHNLYEAFVGEAKAYFRLLAYADEAQAEELPQITALFRAVAEAERIHATRNLQLLGEVVVQDAETNLQASFEREEKAADVFYPQFIREAEEEGDRRAAISFSQARDVEEGARIPLQAGPTAFDRGNRASVPRLPDLRLYRRARAS